MMFNKIICATFSLVSMLLVQQSFSQTKATVTIKKNLNGTVTEETHSIVMDEGRDMQSILSEMGVLDENGNLKEGSQFEIKIDKSFSGATDNFYAAPNLNNFPQVYSKPVKEKRPFLGVRLKDSNKSLEISEVEPHSAAEKAGLQKGDVLVQIDGKDISTYNEFVTSIQTKQIGDKVKIVVLRDGKKKKRNATLGEKIMEVRHPLDNGNDDSFHTNGNLPLFNFRFGPDSITILSPSDDTVKICQPFAWNNGEVPTKETSYLGVTPYNGNTSANNDGIKINVEPQTPAEKMGLRSGDMIVQFNGTPVNTFNELAEAVAQTKPNDTVSLSIIRDGKQKEITGATGKRSCSRVDDFRIFHDFKGMDEIGNYFYNYEFDMDVKDLESHIDELLKGMENEMSMESEKQKSENEFYKSNTSIRIDDVTTEERNLLNKTITPQLASENNLSFERISFLPNANKGTLNLSFQTPENAPVKVMILDSNGNTIFLEERTLADGSYSNTIDIAQQPSGTYYLHIAQGGKTYCKKIEKAGE